MKQCTNQGFTLIELMVVLVVMAILAAIALPNYQSYLSRAACEDAKATLTGAANAMERYRAQNSSYVGSNLAASGYNQSPVDGKAQFNIVIDPATVTANAYLLTATPVAGSRLANRGTLSLSSAGVRGAAGDFLTADVWNSSCHGL
jgi:type IV pilus assembly protein PilE